MYCYGPEPLLSQKPNGVATTEVKRNYIKNLAIIKIIFCFFLVEASATHAQSVKATVEKKSSYSSLTTTPPVIKSSSTSRSYDNYYILGPGDRINVELLDIPELSGSFTIGPDGTLYLPRLRALYVEGLTVEELRYFLTEQYKIYIKSPQVYVKPIGFRPVRVYVGGEITRPGYYMLSGNMVVADQIDISEQLTPAEIRRQTTNLQDFAAAKLRMQRQLTDDINQIQGVRSYSMKWPTLFDALRAAQGVTPYSNLADVKVVRRQPLSSGGGKMQAEVNFLRLITEGIESNNIRLFDGDVVTVSRSSTVMRDQLLAASRSNLSPDYIEVFVSGRVKEPGPQSLPQGATLNQAIASAGGPKILRGQIEFLRFSPNGDTDRRVFAYKNDAASGDYKNPILMNGDVVRVNESLFSASVEILNEITGPAVGIYSVYSLFR